MSYETVEVVALQFLSVCQVLLSVVFNKQEMKIAWSFSSRVTQRKISAVNVNVRFLSQKVISSILYDHQFMSRNFFTFSDNFQMVLRFLIVFKSEMNWYILLPILNHFHISSIMIVNKLSDYSMITVLVSRRHTRTNSFVETKG